jgi:hypothetical protein
MKNTKDNTSRNERKHNSTDAKNTSLDTPTPFLCFIYIYLSSLQASAINPYMRQVNAVTLINPPSPGRRIPPGLKNTGPQIEVLIIDPLRPFRKLSPD